MDKATNAYREELRQCLEEISESLNSTSWYHSIEFVAWDLVHGRDPLLVDVAHVSGRDVEDARRILAVLGEWPLPGTYGAEFVATGDFEPLHDVWTAKEAERGRRLAAKDDARREAPLDDADMELLSRYAARDEDRSIRLDIASRSESVHKLRAKGLIEGRNWILSEISDEGRDLLASSEPPSP